MGYGDRLASGGRSATFPSAPPITQEKWDAIWVSGPTGVVIENYEHPEQRWTLEEMADHLHVGTNKTVRVPKE